MTQFANGTVEAMTVNKQYDSGTQYEMVVAGQKFKTFVKTGDFTPSVGTSVSVDEGMNSKGWKQYTVTPCWWRTPTEQPVAQTATAPKKATTGGWQKDPKTQATISYWAAEERAIQKLDSVIKNNIAMIAAGKKGGMTQAMIDNLTTIDGFTSMVAELTRQDLDVVEDIENFSGKLPTFDAEPQE